MLWAKCHLFTRAQTGNLYRNFLCIIAYTVNILRVDILTPVAELVLNVMLILGLILNVLFCIHFTTTEEGLLFGFFGNVPIIMLLLMAMAENQRLLKKLWIQMLSDLIQGLAK